MYCAMRIRKYLEAGNTWDNKEKPVEPISEEKVESEEVLPEKTELNKETKPKRIVTGKQIGRAHV